MLKLFLYLLLIFLLLTAHDYISENLLKRYLPGYLKIKEYVDVGIILLLGWSLLKMVSKYVYSIFKRISDESTARVMKTVTEIVGVAVLLSITASFLNVSTAASITLGSFIGMVFGFASQTILKNAIAGIFIAIIRPIKIGDSVILIDSRGKEREGIVKEIKLMYVVLEKDGEEIMIPSSSIIENTIRRKTK